MRSSRDKATTYYHWAVGCLSVLAVIAVVFAGAMFVLNLGSVSEAPGTNLPPLLPQPAGPDTPLSPREPQGPPPPVPPSEAGGGANHLWPVAAGIHLLRGRSQKLRKG